MFLFYCCFVFCRQKAAGSAERWEECLRVFNAGLQIMKCAVRREVSTEAEILLSKGVCMSVMLFFPYKEDIFINYFSFY